MAQILLRYGADVEARSPYKGNTALHTAVSRGYDEITQILLDKGADVNARNDHSQTPLQLATKKGFETTLRLLRRYGAE